MLLLNTISDSVAIIDSSFPPLPRSDILARLAGSSVSSSRHMLHAGRGSTFTVKAEGQEALGKSVENQISRFLGSAHESEEVPNWRWLRCLGLPDRFGSRSGPWWWTDVQRSGFLRLSGSEHSGGSAMLETARPGDRNLLIQRVGFVVIGGCHGTAGPAAGAPVARHDGSQDSAASSAGPSTLATSRKLRRPSHSRSQGWRPNPSEEPVNIEDRAVQGLHGVGRPPGTRNDRSPAKTGALQILAQSHISFSGRLNVLPPQKSSRSLHALLDRGFITLQVGTLLQDPGRAHVGKLV